MSSSSKSSVSFCTKYTIDIMRSAGQTPTLTELNKAIVSEAKYHHNWLAAASLFKDFDKIVWERLSRLLNSEKVNSGKKKIQIDNDDSESSISSLKQIWEKTPTALQPLTFTELKLVRYVYQIMVRYAPSLKEANYYYLHLLNNHLDTPIYDEECINHCLNSLIYIISKSKIADYLEMGLELVKIALVRGIGKDPTGILESVSKNILSYHGLKIRDLEKVLFVKKRTDRKTASKRNKKKKKGAKRLQTGDKKNFDNSKNVQNSDLNEILPLGENESNDFSLREDESADENFGDSHSPDSEEISTFLSGDLSLDNFDEQEEEHENIIDSNDELKSELVFDIDKFITTSDESTCFGQSEKSRDNEDDDACSHKTIKSMDE